MGLKKRDEGYRIEKKSRNDGSQQAGLVSQSNITEDDQEEGEGTVLGTDQQ